MTQVPLSVNTWTWLIAITHTVIFGSLQQVIPPREVLIGFMNILWNYESYSGGCLSSSIPFLKTVVRITTITTFFGLKICFHSSDNCPWCHAYKKLFPSWIRSGKGLEGRVKKGLGTNLVEVVFFFPAIVTSIWFSNIRICKLTFKY